MQKYRFIRVCLLMSVFVLLSFAAVSAQEPVMLRFWLASLPEAGAIQAVEQWNAAHPDIQVELVPYTNNTEGNLQMDTALLAQGEVDVFIGYGNVPTLKRRVDAGLIEPLNAYLGDFDVEAEFGTSMTIWDDTVWALPGQGAPWFIYVNKDAFDAAGIEVPAEWTWDEFRAIARQLTSGEGPSRRYAFMLPPSVYINELLIYKFGSDFTRRDGDPCVTTFDDPLWAQVLDLRYQLENVDNSTIPIADITAGRLVAQNEFFAGNVAMVLSGSFMLRYIPNTADYPRDFTVSFAPIPTLDGEPYTYRPGLVDDMIAIGANSMHKEEAAQFLRWIATEGYMNLASFGRLALWTGLDRRVQADAFLARVTEGGASIDEEAFRRVVLEDDRPFTYPTITVGLAEVGTIFNEEAMRVLLGEQTSAEATANMKARADAALASICSQ